MGARDDVRAGLLIWGASGHAAVVADIVELQGKYEIRAFIDDLHGGESFIGHRVISDRLEVAQMRERGVDLLIVAVGDCRARLRLAEEARRLGFTLVNAVHPSAVVARNVTLGEGSVVSAGAVVNTGARIGRNVIVNTGSSVDHDCAIDDGVHIAPGARLGGHTMVGRGTWVGMGAVVIDRIRVGAGAMVAAGAVVVDDVPDGALVRGVPARVVGAASDRSGAR